MVISQIAMLIISREMVVSFPQVMSVPTTHRDTQSVVGDQMPPFPREFYIAPEWYETTLWNANCDDGKPTP